MHNTKQWLRLSHWFILIGILVGLLGCTNSGGIGNAQKFRFGLILVGAKDDKGWSQAHYEGATYVTTVLPDTKLLLVESLNPADKPNDTLESTVEKLVSGGAKLIITASDEFENETTRIAQKYPAVTFISISGDDVQKGKAPANLGNLMGQMEYPKAISGCAAALVTQTGRIGYVAPLVNTETRRLAVATYLGARYCYQAYRGLPVDSLKFQTVWIGFWFHIPNVTLDPLLESNRLIDDNYDVLLSGIDTSEPIDAANTRNTPAKPIWASPYDNARACELAPNNCLGVPFYSWGPSYLETVKAVRDNAWTSSFTWSPPIWETLSDPTRTNVGWVTGDQLSVANKNLLQDFISRLADGSLDLWQGPLVLQDGTEYVASGQSASLEQIWNFPQLLLGMGSKTQ